MFKSRSGPRALVALAGTVAIVLTACTSSTATPAPSAAAEPGRRRHTGP